MSNVTTAADDVRDLAIVDRELDLLFVSPERFRCSPQIGVRVGMCWDELGRWLSQPSVGDSKDEAGAWSPALYQGNVRRKSALVHAYALVVDIDENGDVDAAARVVGRYAAIVHETFSSTNDAPRCRIVLLLAEPIDAATYEATHRIVRAHMGAAGMPADEAAKDASRVSYAPVRRPGAGYRYRIVDGKPLDAHKVLAAQPPAAPRVAPPRPAVAEHRDGYLRAALRRASNAVAGAAEGTRNDTLNRETHSLARLPGLDDLSIERAMLHAAKAAGLPDHEALKTVASALRARRWST